MATWLMKTEPSTYSFADLQKAGHAVWDGVKNNAALGHIRKMAAGDAVFIYHTGDEKQVVGLAEVAKGAYPDPKLKDPKLVVVDLKPKKALGKPVTLAQVKADARFKKFELVTIGRLSVMPVPPEIEKALLELAR